MSSKEKPTLGGTRIKTRKRNIAAPLDPATFADAVVQIYLDNAGDLVSGHRLQFHFSVLDSVVFTGGRTQPGTTKSDEGERHTYSIIDCEPKREAIIPSVLYIQKILRRRPFLIKNLENVMRRFLQSLELFEENERKKLAIFTALTFSQKLSGLPPESVFQPLLKDNLVAKGLVLSFMTDFFKEYLIDNNLDDLISILKRGKMEDDLLNIFPSAKRSAEGFSEHFTWVFPFKDNAIVITESTPLVELSSAPESLVELPQALESLLELPPTPESLVELSTTPESLVEIPSALESLVEILPSVEGLVALVEYNEKKVFEVKLKEMKSALTTQIAEETDISEVIETVKQRVKDAKLPDIEVVRILWDVIMDAVQWSGKNQQQNANAALRQVDVFTY
ncbi:hypothetical protein HHK36_027216 [Tetracentron sinense]|uniref:5MP1/2-like HEAT domain-containing protein n=1 Tax=Tetracentron sinense TaxID=13715 RepID=A0A834YK28_TETSI|nr:hypothetical protein HHK36_027216 [Tetracentron sinense]